MIATSALDLVQTVLIMVGVLAVVGTVAYASAYVSIKNGERNHALNVARVHEEAETQRHRDTINHETHMDALARDERRSPLVVAPVPYEAPEEGPPIGWVRRRRG